MQKDRVNRWQANQSSAYLSSEFGQQLACKKFNLTLEQLKEKVGVYSKGKRKGQLKGQLVWLKVVRGGWVKTGAYDFDTMTPRGFIVRPGICFAFHIVDAWSQELIMSHEDTVFDDGHYLNYNASLENTLNTKHKRQSQNEAG